MVIPTLERPEVPDTRHVILWRFPERVAILSSAPVGGGLSIVDWICNVGVTSLYPDPDVAHHAHQVANVLGLDGIGATFFTAADVRLARHATVEGVNVNATVGVTRPTWAADADDAWAPWSPGTINVVVQVPVPLTPAAAVNAAMTATEAKVQALVEAGVPGTGTATDAVAICWPTGPDPAPYGGPRSPWGARLARAVHDAVADGLSEPRPEGATGPRGEPS